ncbi:Unconventional myosin-VI [Hondaea fermentalgiana]|uniref:Unconventional myosin-VI n=1 Tax=Hondaea fermentalgiana TaxID=2315210 RepID=A0A2R5GBB6_9STRA|nr:Unconventional myosin-VI [Hondaea fermentalgiana]|eukprot:GBG25004.1 Unconventional myosin-VI [Hondaea fermentalgiana]
MELDALGVNSSVWVSGPGDGGTTEYYQGVVTSRDGPYVVVRSLLGKGTYNVDAETQEVFRANRRVVTDMTALQYFHVPGILHNVRQRAVEDEPYTFLGASVLVAVNPLRPLAQPEDVLGTPDAIRVAHPYAIAEAAYQQMQFAMTRPSLGEKVDQSIVVGGESGAGKTESSKMVLHHLVERSGGSSGGLGPLDQRLLEISPILESFGNAATKRNANSSRFGKFIKVHFSKSGAIVAASVETYLLERSRVTQHMLGERAFHVFHQLLEGASEEMREELALMRTFSYLHATAIEGAGRKRAKSMAKLELLGEDDERKYHELCSALDTLGVDKDGIMRILAGILHLGNIKFDEKEGALADEAEVRTTETLEIASTLLGLEPEALEQLVLERKVRTVGETIVARRDADAAKIAVDAVAKKIYVELFEYLVARISEALSNESDAEAQGFIGVLDIFGFESFRRNDLEQLLINYTNEALQETFNTQVFEAEAALYRSEGLLTNGMAPVSVGENAAAMQLLGGVRGDLRAQPGILRLIDGETQSPQPSDSKLTTSIHRTYGASDTPARKSGAYVPVHPKDAKYCFSVRHYAGEVKYTTGHFIEKNVDRVPDEVTEVLASSSSDVLAEVFTASAVGGGDSMTRVTQVGRALTKATATVTARFQASIESLIDTLDATRAFFIRCIKPNSRMERGKSSKSDWFDVQYVIPQLYNLSIPQTAEVLKGGFPTRIAFEDLVETYKGMMPDEALHAFEVFCASDSRLFVKALFEAFGIPAENYKIGLTRVFFKSGMLDELNSVLSVASSGSVPEEVAANFRLALVRSRWRGVFAGVLAYSVFEEILRTNRARESAVTILQRLAKRRAREARRRREEALRREEEARQREEAARREAERLRVIEEQKRAAREAAEAANRRAEAERLRQAEILAEEKRLAEIARAAAEAAAAEELQKRIAAAEAAAAEAEAQEAAETERAAQALGSEDALASKLDQERQLKSAVANGENDDEDDDFETMTVHTRARARSRTGSMVSHKTVRQTIVERARKEALLHAIPEEDAEEDVENGDGGANDDDDENDGASMPLVFQDVRYVSLDVATNKRRSVLPIPRMFRRRASIAKVIADGDSWTMCSIIIRGYTLQFFESVRDAAGKNPQGVNKLGEVVVTPALTRMEMIDGIDESEKLMKLTVIPQGRTPGREILFHVVDPDGNESLLAAYLAAVKAYKREAKLAHAYETGNLADVDEDVSADLAEARAWLREGLITRAEFDFLKSKQITGEHEYFEAEAARYGEYDVDATYRVHCEDCGEAVIFVKDYEENPISCPYCSSKLPVDEHDLYAESAAHRKMVDERIAFQEEMRKKHGGEGFPLTVNIASRHEITVSSPSAESYYDPSEMRNVISFAFPVISRNYDSSALHVVEEFEFSASWEELRHFADRLANPDPDEKEKLSSKERKKLPDFPEDPKRDRSMDTEGREATARLKDIVTDRRLLRVEQYMLELLLASRQMKKTFFTFEFVRNFFNLPVDASQFIKRKMKTLTLSQLEKVAELANEFFAQIVQFEVDESSEIVPPPVLREAINSVRPALEATADPVRLASYATKADQDERDELSRRAAQVLGVLIECENQISEAFRRQSTIERQRELSASAQQTAE